MKKYIITTAGGLGNQMINYVLWNHLKKKNFSILYPKEHDLKDHNGYELNRIFKNAQSPSIPSKIIDRYIKFCQHIDRISIYITRRILKKEIHISHLLPYAVVNFPNWNNYHVAFSENRNELFHFFKFPELKNEKNKEIASKILSSNSVSIHIRRGDYQSIPRWRITLGDICDKQYYQKAIEESKTIYSDPTYFIFSDDINWTKENLELPTAFYIDWNKGENSFIDMQLMSLCKCNILANSTFSLMAAWLNTNKNPQIIVPKKWRHYHNDMTYKKYIPKNWIIIDNSKPLVTIEMTVKPTSYQFKNILKQSFNDFSIQIYYNTIVKDRRIITHSQNSLFTFQCTSDNINKFRDRRYLENWLINQFVK